MQLASRCNEAGSLLCQVLRNPVRRSTQASRNVKSVTRARRSRRENAGIARTRWCLRLATQCDDQDRGRWSCEATLPGLKEIKISPRQQSLRHIIPQLAHTRVPRGHTSERPPGELRIRPGDFEGSGWCRATRHVFLHPRGGSRTRFLARDPRRRLPEDWRTLGCQLVGRHEGHRLLLSMQATDTNKPGQCALVGFATQGMRSPFDPREAASPISVLARTGGSIGLTTCTAPEPPSARTWVSTGRFVRASHRDSAASKSFASRGCMWGDPQ